MTSLTRKSSADEIIGVMCEAFIRGGKRRGQDWGPKMAPDEDVLQERSRQVVHMIRRALEREEESGGLCGRTVYMANIDIAKELCCAPDYVRKVRKRWKEGKLGQ